MNNLQVSAGLGAFVGSVIAGSLLFFAVASGRIFTGNGGKRIERATINLDQIGDQCQITTDPQTIQAVKKQTIEWTIVDRCGVTQAAEVEVIFRSGNDPFEITCVKKGKKKIRCTLKDDAPIGSYKYDVMAGNALREDPELEIVQ